MSPGRSTSRSARTRFCRHVPLERWPQHQRRRRPGSGGRRVHRRRVQHRELRRQRHTPAKGGAGNPAIDAIAGRHRSHRDPRFSRHCSRWPIRSTPTPLQPANRTPPTRRFSFRRHRCRAEIRRHRTSASSSRHRACAIDAVTPGARRRDVRQPERTGRRKPCTTVRRSCSAPRWILWASTRGRSIVIVNHLRSFIDIELVDGEGPRVRAKRTAQAESVAGLLQELQTHEPWHRDHLGR